MIIHRLSFFLTKLFALLQANPASRVGNTYG